MKIQLLEAVDDFTNFHLLLIIVLSGQVSIPIRLRDMSSSSGQAVRNVSKSADYSSNISSSPASFQGANNSIESGPQRRSGGNGSFGAGSTTRTTSAARNNQAKKGQHKKHHRPNLVNEDAYSESVSNTNFRTCNPLIS